MAAAAAVTETIELTTAILIAPFRGNGALLAKQLASVDSISGGRLTVGIAVGRCDHVYKRRPARSTIVVPCSTSSSPR